jgi:DNA polymerase-1
MQGTAADIIKKAMLAVDDWLQQGGADARMVMQVHDELVLEIAEGEVSAASAQLCDLMSAAASLSVPLVVEAGVGDNWDQAH